VCAAALIKSDKATELSIRRSLQSVKASAFTCYFTGAVFVMFGIGTLIAFHGDIFLPLFLGGSGVALIICGAKYAKATKQ
jgi:hypothetical protein